MKSKIRKIYPYAALVTGMAWALGAWLDWPRDRGQGNLSVVILA